VNSDVMTPKAATGATLAVEQIVSDTYRIVRKVGSGGMGEIYEATHRRLAGRYAIKLLRSELAATPDALARFQREANVTSALRHPNIVQVVDFSTLPGGAPFMVMEFLDGLELAEVMKRSGPLPLSRVVSEVKQIASGLTAAHENGVVHRDLKPQNIFVLEVVGHEQELLKIVDFGISKVKDLAAKITDTSTVLGTVHYMSPEQARGRVDEIDARTDQFALAAIVYEMLTGQEAFTGDSVSSLLYQIVHEEPAGLVGDTKSSIPPAVAAVLRRGLAKDKERRFATVMTFSRALEEAAAAGDAPNANTVASKRAALDVARQVARPARPRLWIGVGLSVLLVAGTGAGVWVARRDRPSAVDVSPRPAIVAPVLQTAKEPAEGPVPMPVHETPQPLPTNPPPEQGKRATSTATTRPMKTRGALKSAPASAPEAAKLAPDASKPKSADCNPNFFFDERGDKRFKRECFLDR
jgi:tRNA A-37 threonylcarbamoyl transferase component Bud32